MVDRVRRRLVAVAMPLLAALLVGCAAPKAGRPPSDRPNLAAFSAHLSGAAQVPPVRSAGSGRVDAVLDRQTRLLRWRVTYSGLSGPLVAGHFHGPAGPGSVAGVALRWPPARPSPLEGRATLTPAQASDLLAGRWYASLYTAEFPGGELRGQLIERR